MVAAGAFVENACADLLLLGRPSFQSSAAAVSSDGKLLVIFFGAGGESGGEVLAEFQLLIPYVDRNSSLNSILLNNLRDVANEWHD